MKKFRISEATMFDQDNHRIEHRQTWTDERWVKYEPWMDGAEKEFQQRQRLKKGEPLEGDITYKPDKVFTGSEWLDCQPEHNPANQSTICVSRPGYK